jgi:hypothetical protein
MNNTVLLVILTIAALATPRSSPDATDATPLASSAQDRTVHLSEANAGRLVDAHLAATIQLASDRVRPVRRSGRPDVAAILDAAPAGADH